MRPSRPRDAPSRTPTDRLKSHCREDIRSPDGAIGSVAQSSPCVLVAARPLALLRSFRRAGSSLGPRTSGEGTRRSRLLCPRSASVCKNPSRPLCSRSASIRKNSSGRVGSRSASIRKKPPAGSATPSSTSWPFVRSVQGPRGESASFRHFPRASASASFRDPRPGAGSSIPSADLGRTGSTWGHSGDREGTGRSGFS